MLIYIIRHGDAHHQSSTGRDRDRTLTERGHQQAKAIGEFLANCESKPQQVIASPYIRAQETASAIWDALAQDHHTDDRLGADQATSEMLSVVSDHQHIETIAIVSHMPTVAEFESLLTQGPASDSTPMMTGELKAIRIDSDELIGHGALVVRYRMGNGSY